jgi:misacylated tRNA(Ala) deacylase
MEGNMATQLMHQTDSYLAEVRANVVAVDGQAVALDRTIFYPGGGGQVPDTGTLESNGVLMPVVEVKKKDDAIWHTVEGTPPAVGSEVTCRLDWPHRYQVMRTHTAFHILCGVIFKVYGAHVTGGNMKPLEGRMDFELEHMTGNFASDVEEKINAEVQAARDIRVAIHPREEAFQIPDLIRTKINLLPEGINEVRTVEIEGLDLQADGGTHVANTREVGYIHVVGHESKGKINKRLRIALDA